MRYAVPDNPADPEMAALELIVRLPGLILHTYAMTEVLQDYCSALHAEGTFAGLLWDDAKAAAAAVSFEVTTWLTSDATGHATYSRALTTCRGTTASARRGVEHRGDGAGAVTKFPSSFGVA